MQVATAVASRPRLHAEGPARLLLCVLTCALLQVYADEERISPAAKFYGLRQQAEKDSDEPYMCVSDFIAPKGSGVADYVGAFACSAGHGLDKVVKGFKEAGVSTAALELGQGVGLCLGFPSVQSVSICEGLLLFPGGLAA